MRKLTISAENWELKQPFRISYRTMHDVSLVVVELEQDGVVGRGEGAGVFYRGETIESISDQIEAARAEIEAGASRDDLYNVLPAGGARCAVDCALWDLEAKLSGQTVWEMNGIDPKPVTTVYTIGLDHLEAMAENARGTREPRLKVKVNADAPIDQVRVVREVRPDAKLIVDANQSLTPETLPRIADAYAELGVEMLEQPLPARKDDILASFNSPVLLGADESLLTTRELDYVADRYQVANIKLDKTGGLTEALRLAKQARDAGLDLMVGCMLGTSLGMAPAAIVGQYCRFVDIDGPLLMKNDRDHAMQFVRGEVSVPSRELWG
ncbi:MAG: N-acetyl-D-Glu racemase DgcA [Pseudomonadota bacterium]